MMVNCTSVGISNASKILSTQDSTSPVTRIYLGSTADFEAGATLIYSVSYRADSALFEYSAATGTTTFKTSPNFLGPSNSRANNANDLIVQASDSALTVTKVVSITVEEVLETKCRFASLGAGPFLMLDQFGRIAKLKGHATEKLLIFPGIRCVIHKPVALLILDGKRTAYFVLNRVAGLVIWHKSNEFFCIRGIFRVFFESAYRLPCRLDCF